MDKHPSFFGWYRGIGRLISQYYEAAPWPFEPTLPDYGHWLTSLPDDERVLYSQLGFTACQSANAFRCYWLEKREYRLLDYLSRHLSPDGYQTCLHHHSPLSAYLPRSETTEQPFLKAISNP